MGFYQFRAQQELPASKEQVWKFISNPENLQKITPSNLDFRITSKHLPDEMYAGMIISYQVKPLFNIPVTWVTEITHVKALEYFVDEQRIGPYKMWHHEHWLQETTNGVLMTDIVSYKPPFGWLGNIANHLIIRKKLQAIFKWRELALNEIFPEKI